MKILKEDIDKINFKFNFNWDNKTIDWTTKASSASDAWVKVGKLLVEWNPGDLQSIELIAGDDADGI